MDLKDLDRTARIAGFLYLIVVATGVFSLAYVPSQIVVQADPSATVSNIATSESLYRLGIAASLICYTAFLVLPFALYRLLRPAGNRIAVLMVACAVASVPIALVNLQNKLDILSLVSGTGYPETLPIAEVQAQVMLLHESYGNGILVSEVFWGLWLLPFGYLVFKSRLLPRTLGILLMMGCFGYLVDVFGTVLLPGYTESAIANYVRIPASVGEIGTCLWLLLVGVREPSRRAENARNATDTTH